MFLDRPIKRGSKSTPHIALIWTILKDKHPKRFFFVITEKKLSPQKKRFHQKNMFSPKKKSYQKKNFNRKTYFHQKTHFSPKKHIFCQ